MNTGHDVKLVLDDPSPHAINISGGPLSYKYRVAEITFHFGSIDSIGSEHTIDGQSFPAEVRSSPRTCTLFQMFWNKHMVSKLHPAAYMKLSL